MEQPHEKECSLDLGNSYFNDMSKNEDHDPLRHNTHRIVSSSDRRALLKALWLQDSSKDMVIWTRGMLSISCHAALFSVISEFTRQLLKNHETPITLSLPDVSPQSATHFVRMLYGFECPVEYDDEMAILLAALGVEDICFKSSPPSSSEGESLPQTGHALSVVVPIIKPIVHPKIATTDQLAQPVLVPIIKATVHPTIATTDNLAAPEKGTKQKAVFSSKRLTLAPGTPDMIQKQRDKCQRMVVKKCWKCNGQVKVVERYYMNLRNEWGFKPKTNDIAISCGDCSSVEKLNGLNHVDDDLTKDLKSKLTEARSCQPCRLIYFGSGHHTCPPNTQECPTCGRVFVSWIKFEYHMNKEKGLAPFKCEYCDYATFSPTMLKTSHLARNLCPGYQTKESLKRSGTRCSKCPMLLTNKDHDAKFHNPNLPSVCGEAYIDERDETRTCEYRVLDEDKLVAHKAKYHGIKDVDKLQCPRCPTMVSKKGMVIHEKEHHDENLPYGCDICSYRALLPHSIKTHKGLYHKEKKFVCGLGCGQAFTTSGYRLKHEQRWCSKSAKKEDLALKEKEDGTYHREKAKRDARNAKKNDRVGMLLTNPSLLKAFSCDDCHFTSVTAQELKCHFEKTHSAQAVAKAEEKLKQNWRLVNPKMQCDKCSFFGYNFKEHLYHHHDPNLPYSCDSCGYRALSLRAITIHTAKHHTEKKNHCRLGCGKSFKDPWYQTRHEERYCVNSPDREEWKKREAASENNAAMLALKRKNRKQRSEQYKMLRKK